MAGKDDGGDKTEKPTPKRLKDARKKGDIPKSKDVTSTVELIAWLVVIGLGAGFAGERLVLLFDASVAAAAGRQPFAATAGALGQTAFEAFIAITALAFLPVVAIGLLTEFLQTGAIVTFEKMKPSLDKMNPVEGLKRMFSMDNLVELLKTLIKALLIGFITLLVLKGSLPEILGLVGAQPLPTAAGVGRSAGAAALDMSQDLTLRLLAWTLGVFIVVAVVDAVYQRGSFIKKLKMSRRDIRQEHKDNEGDPHIRSNRRQLHQEWATNNAVAAAGSANVLVVNPTHIAIALDYDPATCPVPMIAARGEGSLAALMRQAAEDAGVPVVRHVEVARALYERGTLDDFVPKDMFEAVAEVILWARRIREDAAAKGQAA